MNPFTPNARFVRGLALLLFAMTAACSTAADPIASPAETPSPSATEVASGASPSPAVAATASVTPLATPTATDAGPLDIKAYFPLYLRNDESPPVLIPVHRTVEQTAAIGAAAMNALLAGPTDQERAHDLRLGTVGTTIPEGTRLLGLDIEDGLATVDLSAEFQTGDIADRDIESWAFRLAQVTYTITQFPTVEGVSFRIDGRPIKAIEGHEGTPIDVTTRSAYFDQLPAIFVDDPAWGSPVDESFAVSGVAQVVTYPSWFEAALVDGSSDEILSRQTIRAACGYDCWLPPGGGEFRFEIAMPDGASPSSLLLRVWEPAPDENGIVNFLQYPLR